MLARESQKTLNDDGVHLHLIPGECIPDPHRRVSSAGNYTVVRADDEVQDLTEGACWSRRHPMLTGPEWPCRTASQLKPRPGPLFVDQIRKVRS